MPTTLSRAGQVVASEATTWFSLFGYIANEHPIFLPTLNLIPIERWVTPEEFETYREIGLKKGFLEVVSGPMVRSSYRAERALEKNNAGLNS